MRKAALLRKCLFHFGDAPVQIATTAQILTEPCPLMPCYRRRSRARLNASPPRIFLPAFSVQKKGLRRLLFLRNLLESGSVLFSRAVSSQVPSALRGLTSVFGMGTGGSLSLLPPEILFPFLPSSFPENCTDPFPLPFTRLRFRLTLASTSSRSASPTHCFRLLFLLFPENFT